MKRFTFHFLLSVAVWLGCISTGSGQDLTVTLSQPAQTAPQGAFVTFHGTIRNNGASTLFLNGSETTVTLRGTVILPAMFDLLLDESSFTENVPPKLDPAEEWTGNLFRIKVGLDAAATTYDGSFAILGGTGPVPYGVQASATFHLTIPGPAPVAGPAAPTGLKVSVAGSNLLLEWTDNANNEEGFSIEQSTSGSTYSLVSLVGTDRTYYTVGPVNAGVTYFFRVRAFNGFNTLTYSPFSNIALGGIIIPPQPPALVGWNAQWAYMNPMGGASPGALPPRPAGGADTDFDTTWFLPEETFVTQYDGPTFGASPALTGTPGMANTYDSGIAAGPLGFPTAGMDYFSTPGAEFTSFGKILTVPSTGQRRTSYYRHTFTVPPEGLASPTLRYLIDDAAYFYLDGVLVATVNIAPDSLDPTKPVADVFPTQVSTQGNEASIETVNLSAPPGLVSGTANARVWVSVPSLAAGTHTLAVSVHNATGSSDSCMALQLGPALPNQTIFVGASDASAQVATADNGAFIVARTGDLSSPLEVSFDLAGGPGQAERGTRFDLAPDSLTASFAAGQANATIVVNPLADTAVLGTQMITLNLVAGAAYAIATPSSATVQLFDSPINTWKIQEFGSLAAAQGPDAADNAAPSGDGISNLLKYALGLPALVPSAEGLPVVALEDFAGNIHLTLTLIRPHPAPSDISYHVEVIEYLDNPIWESAELVPGYPNVTGDTEILKFRDPEPSAGKTSDFIRLRVTRP